MNTLPLTDTAGYEPTVVGVDLSLTSTGIADRTNELSTIASSPDGTTLLGRHGRLLNLVGAILDAAHLWPTNRTAARYVIIEAPSLGQHRQAGTFDRSGLWWILVDKLVNAGVTVIDVTPATLKKFATGKGNATKADMRMALYKRSGIDCADDNQVDAYFLRQIGLHLLHHPDAISLPKTHLDALTKIDTTPLAPSNTDPLAA